MLMSATFLRKVLYASKAVREKNSLRNVYRLLGAMFNKAEANKEQPQFIQVNVDLGDGKLYRITGAKYDKMSQSIRVFIDKEHPLTYPEFWPHKLKTKDDERQE